MKQGKVIDVHYMRNRWIQRKHKRKSLTTVTFVIISLYKQSDMNTSSITMIVITIKVSFCCDSTATQTIYIIYVCKLYCIHLYGMPMGIHVIHLLVFIFRLDC